MATFVLAWNPSRWAWEPNEFIWDDHWDGSGRSTTYADLEWDVVVDPIDRLAVDLLKVRVPAIRWDRIQGSGVVVAAPSDEQLEVLWAEHLDGVPFHSPEEGAAWTHLLGRRRHPGGNEPVRTRPCGATSMHCPLGDELLGLWF